MRFYTGFGIAVDEIKRELAEMSISVHPQTMQDKIVADNPDYNTMELQNYMYMVSGAVETLGELTPNQPWADAEFEERISGIAMNPGKAYLLREEVWDEFLHDGRFSYTYAERMSSHLNKIIEEIRRNPESRQLYLNIWDWYDLRNMGGKSRVPCSLGYLFQVRRDKLNITYFMRSCDFITHYQNDAYLAVKLLDYVAKQTGYKPGTFTHYIGSLHVYAKDVKGVF